MLIDTDVMIWCLRGHAKALKTMEKVQHRLISQITRMELTIGCRNKREIILLKRFLDEGDFEMVRSRRKSEFARICGSKKSTSAMASALRIR